MSGEEIIDQPDKEEDRVDKADLKEKPQPFRIEVLEKMSTLIAAAFGFVAAFAWNETFKMVLREMVAEDVTILAQFIYAIVITVFAVILIIIVARATAKAKARLEK
jgi:acyl-CoA reductase-like NAD-dependent aldehyde dehydrogenase